MRGEKRILSYVRGLRRGGGPSTIMLYTIRALNGEEWKEVLKMIDDMWKGNDVSEQVISRIDELM